METLLLVLIVAILLFGAGPILRLLGGCLSMGLILLVGFALLAAVAMIFTQAPAN